MGNKNFYANLKIPNKALLDLLADESSFIDVPKTWHIVVVDIQNSTLAVSQGRHHEINLTSTGAIISVLNTIRREKKYIEIPYFFGGDGATFIIPGILLEKVISVLNNFSHHIKTNTGLILRVGQLSVSELITEKSHLRIAKHKLTDMLTIPIVLGNGLKLAEEIIKNNFVEKNLVDFRSDLLNLEGMECRWNQIDPTKTGNKVICLLVDSISEKDQGLVYSEVLKELENIFGNFKSRQPIKSNKLKLDFSFKKIREEMKISLVQRNWFYLFRNWLVTLMGSIYLNLTDNGKQYLKQIGQLSHTFMLDGSINTIFTGDQIEIDRFLGILNKMEKENTLVYGIHITHASVMSCYVLDRKTKHAHFVDGTEGGYTSAAKMLKEKLKKKLKEI